MARVLGNQFFLKGFQQDQPSPLACLWGRGTCAWVCRGACARPDTWLHVPRGPGLTWLHVRACVP